MDGPILYSSVTYATPQCTHYRTERYINVWKYCRRALVRDLHLLSKCRVYLNGRELKYLTDYTFDYYDRERIKFAKDLLPEQLKFQLLRTFFSLKTTAPKRYGLVVIGTHKDPKKHNIVF